MAKDKTKPRPQLEAVREAARKSQKAAAAKRRRKILINILIAVVIIGLATAGIIATVMHVDAGKRALEYTGNAKVTQITPPNATSDGLAIVAEPGATPAADAITVDLHVDYQDGPSAQVMAYYIQALDDLANAGSIKLNYHLHMASDTSNKNQSAGRATVAAACADTVGAFAKYNAAIWAAASTAITAGGDGFSNSQLLNDFTATAGITGDDLTNFTTCYNNRATSAFVTAMNTGNLTTKVPNNTSFNKGVTSTPVMLANNLTVDINSDYSAATAAQDDKDSLLTLLQNTINPAGSGS